MLQLSIFQASMESVFVQFCQSLFFVCCRVDGQGQGCVYGMKLFFNLLLEALCLKSPDTTKEKLRRIQGIETKAEYEMDCKLMSRIFKKFQQNEW